MSIVITISRQLGSRGSYIAANVAKQLNLRYLDREILHRAAEMAGFPDEQMIAQLEERERIPGWLGRILNSLESIPPVPTIPSATLREGYTYDDMIMMLMQQRNLTREEAIEQLLAERQRAEMAQGYGALVRQVILECAQMGDVMIVGRGGQVILKDMPNALHVQIIASEHVRIHNLMERMGIEAREAERQIRQSDKIRSRYLRHFHDAEWGDPTLYDLVLNTGKLSVDLASELVDGAAKRVARQLL